MRLDPVSGRGHVLAWFGLVGGPAAWTAEHIVGYGMTEAACGAGGSAWGIDTTTWELALTLATAAIVLTAVAASATMVFATRGVHHDGPPPLGRLHFMAVAGLFVATLFLFLTLMAGLGAVTLAGCHQG
ncbi:MAG TPA: hypothetical protein VE693_01115 [Gaiellaceae bacterium]|jgi:hypothetical protein|nr:hypothetical protein [Gaiellaceae bacterium]